VAAPRGGSGAGRRVKRDRDPYRPSERQWVKTKNRATTRFAEEREGVGRRVAARRPATKPL